MGAIVTLLYNDSSDSRLTLVSAGAVQARIEIPGTALVTVVMTPDHATDCAAKSCG